MAQCDPPHGNATTWAPSRNKVGTTWEPRGGGNVGTAWEPRGNSVEPQGNRAETQGPMQCSSDCSHVVPTRFPGGSHAVPRCFTREPHVVTAWLPRVAAWDHRSEGHEGTTWEPGAPDPTAVRRSGSGVKTAGSPLVSHLIPMWTPCVLRCVSRWSPLTGVTHAIPTWSPACPHWVGLAIHFH